MASPVFESHLIFLIPLIPGISAAILGLTWLFGTRLHKTTVKMVACGSVFISFLISAICTKALLQLPENERHLTQTLWTWFAAFGASPAERIHLPFSFEVDPLSATMILVVTGIGLLIHIYSTAYMADDDGFQKFFAYLNLFMFSMLILVLGANFLMMFIGWEGVGLCSYLLIGFWYKDLANARAAKKAFVVNRIGDFLFITGMLALFWGVGMQEGPHGGFFSMTFRDMREHLPSYIAAQENVRILGIPLITFCTLMFFGGATGKSAQIPLFVWLPDAMAGPTPVSALIHAATMVTSGLYMITRLNFLFSLAPDTLLVIGIIGALTALMAASIGLFQYDIKKVLAYSTVSQLGYMFLAMGAGAYTAGMFHVFTHAFFKALMFLGSGSVIHAMHHALPHGVDAQDMRNMGGLRKYMPVTFWTFMVGWVAICGIFPFAGFWSKDEILWKAVEHGMAGKPIWYAIYAIGLGGAALTAFYMTRQVVMVFFGEYRGKKIGEEYLAKHAHGDHGHGHDAHADDHHEEEAHELHDPEESPFAITFPLRTLAIGSAVVGLFGVGAWATHLTGIPNYWNAWLAPVIVSTAEVHHARTLVESDRLYAQHGDEHATDAAHGTPAAHPAAETLKREPAHHAPDKGHAKADAHAAASGDHGGGAHHAPWWLELGFAILSVAVAAASMRFAWTLYQNHPERPAAALKQYAPGGPKASSPGGVFYRWAYNKYYVDEIYEAGAIRPVGTLSRYLSLFDKYVVDGIVNGLGYALLVVRWIAGLIDKYIVDGVTFLGFAKFVAWFGQRIRSLQTGDLQGYLRWIGYGALATIGFYMLVISK